LHKERESSAFKAQRESGQVGAGLRKLREVHPGVPWLNRQFAAVVHRFAVLQNNMQNYKDNHIA
jgi:hypothetical protein